MAIGLRDGYIEFRFELGNGVGVAKSKTTVSLNQPHNVTVAR